MHLEFTKEQLEQNLIETLVEVTRQTNTVRRLRAGEDPAIVQAELRDLSCSAGMRAFALTGAARLYQLLHDNFPDFFTVEQSEIAALGYLNIMGEASAQVAQQHTANVVSALACGADLPDDKAARRAMIPKRREAYDNFARYAQHRGLGGMQTSFTHAAWCTLSR